jgi:micrococcal nuclease
LHGKYQEQYEKDRDALTSAEKEFLAASISEKPLPLYAASTSIYARNQREVERTKKQREIAKQAGVFSDPQTDEYDAVIEKEWDAKAHKPGDLERATKKRFAKRRLGCRPVWLSTYLGAMMAGMLGKSPFVAVLLLTSMASAGELRGRVVKTTDGDTITVLDQDNHQHKVRLSGIDAPERKQPFGTVAREVLGELVQARDAVVEEHGQDRYGRTLGTVFIIGSNGTRTNANLAMVKQGLAWQYTRYDHSKELADAEKEARDQRRGLWNDKGPVAPWDWRRQKRRREPRGATSLACRADQSDLEVGQFWTALLGFSGRCLPFRIVASLRSRCPGVKFRGQQPHLSNNFLGRHLLDFFGGQ